MKNYIITGTPGSGKTAIIRALEMQGHCVVEESATDVISYEQLIGSSEPWKNKEFIDYVIFLQKKRQLEMNDGPSNMRFYDRSPICTYALAIYLGFEPSKTLMEEIERVKKENIYKKKVFFIENMGFLKQTEARKISFEESLIFESVHLNAYEKFGFECIKVPVKPLLERVSFILKFL